MIYIGIDIAKHKHYASAVDEKGNVLITAFPFFNSAKGFEFLLEKLNTLDFSDCLFGLESTGHYAENLIYFLNNKNYSIGVINPIQTNALRRASIRKTKTDKIDTVLITETLRLGHYTKYDKSDINVLKLKSLTRFRTKLVESRTKLKIQITSCIDQIFPEIAKVFNDIHSKSCYAILSKYGTPKNISKVRIDTLTNILKSNSRGRFKKEFAETLKSTAKESIGIDNTSLAIQVKHSISQVELLNSQIDDIEKLIKQIMDELDTPILSVPGIGYIIGAIILAEIGSISKFDSAKKLLAYAGLDPSVIQSGNFNATTTKISKRGSSYLRYALRTASSLIIFNNDTFNQYYLKKRDLGKSYGNAVGHVAFKLVRVIFKILTQNIKFDLA